MKVVEAVYAPVFLGALGNPILFEDINLSAGTSWHSSFLKPGMCGCQCTPTPQVVWQTVSASAVKRLYDPFFVDGERPNTRYKTSKVTYQKFSSPAGSMVTTRTLANLRGTFVSTSHESDLPENTSPPSALIQDTAPIVSVSHTQVVRAQGSGPDWEWTKTTDLLDEFTDEELEGLVDDDISGAESVTSEVEDLDLGYNVTRSFLARIYEASYSNSTDFEAALAARIAGVQANLDSLEAVYQQALDGLPWMDQAVADAEAAVSNWIAALEGYTAQGEQAKADALQADLLFLKLWNKYHHDPSLDEAEKAALMEEIDQAQEVVWEKVSDYYELRMYMESWNHNIPNLQEHVALAKRNKHEEEQKVVLARINRDNYAAVLTAVQNNENALWYSINAGGISQAENSFVGNNMVTSINAPQSSMTKRQGRYRLSLDVSSYEIPPEGVDLTLRWRERTWKFENLEEGQTARDTYEWVERSEVVHVAPEDTSVSTSWHTVAVPPRHHRVAVVGMPTAPTGSIVAHEHQGGTMTKTGFLGFSSVEGIPTVYRELAWSGGYEGCPESGEDPKVYTGKERYSITGVFNNSQLTFPEPLSPDMLSILTGQADWPGLTPRPPYKIGSTDFLPTGPEPSEESSTVRTWRRRRSCGTIEQQEVLQAELSDPWTTEDLREMVDVRIGDEWSLNTSPIRMGGSQGPGGFPDLFEKTPWTYPVAERWISPDETRYRHVRARFRFRLTRNGNELDRAETLRWTENHLDIATGVITQVEKSEDNYLTGSQSQVTDDEWRMLEAEEGEMVWISDIRGDEWEGYEGAILVEVPEAPDYLQMSD